MSASNQNRRPRRVESTSSSVITLHYGVWMDRVRGAGDAFEANPDALGESSVRSPKRWLQRIIPALADVGEKSHYAYRDALTS
jgi:hypothetical protein